MKIKQLKTNINENQVHVESTLAEIFALCFLYFSWFIISVYVLLCFIIYVGFLLISWLKSILEVGKLYNYKVNKRAGFLGWEGSYINQKEIIKTLSI